MKYIKVIALSLAVAAFAVGCACNKGACCPSKPGCAMKCCTDTGTACDKCATCSKK